MLDSPKENVSENGLFLSVRYGTDHYLRRNPVHCIGYFWSNFTRVRICARGRLKQNKKQ